MTPACRSRALLIGCLVALLLALALLFTVAAHARDRCAKRCQERVVRREAHEKWRRAVHAYGPGRLHARMRCESGSHGGYRLRTTGNGYWFAHQFNVAAWSGAGGRMRNGEPVGVWTRRPSRLEQDYRIIRWERVHGGDPNPSCP